MLRITQQSSPDAAKSYYAQADYYLDDQEMVGHWGGRGADRLNLHGTVEEKAFHRLCDNLHPETSETLTARVRDQRTVGYDWTFSAPKSLSVLYALTQDENLLDVFRDSVQETMREAEREMKTRVRKDGKDENRTTGNMLWAEFVHLTGRPVAGIPDPQLHAHVFVFNATHDGVEQQWKAGQFRDLKRDARYFEAGFHARLANKLADLGYGIDRTRTGWEISGVPAQTIRRFSRRTQLIEEVAQARGITDPKVKDKLGALTRESKQHHLFFSQLQEEWRSRMTPAEQQELKAVEQKQYAIPIRPEAAPEQAMQWAIDHSFARNSVISEKQLLETALRYGVGQTTVESAKAQFAKLGVIQREVDGQRLVTTKTVLAEENAVVSFAQRGRGTRKALGVHGRSLCREWLNDGQRRAVGHVLTSRDRVILIRGAAGTGKTTMMKETIEGIEAGGKQVVVLAPSADASRGILRGEGIAEADTVSMFLKNQEQQQVAAGQVIWIDEAGLLSTKQMKGIFDIAERLDARVVLSGDKRQHRSVERGDTLRLLEEHAGLPIAEVHDIQRQQGKYKEAVKFLSEGKTAEGFQILDQLGWVKELPDELRESQLTADYVQILQEGKTALVVSPSHVEGEAIAGAIRGRLKQVGTIRGEERVFATWKPAHLTEAEQRDPLSYQPGDMLQFHQNVPGIRAGTRILHDEQATLPLDQAKAFQVYRPSLTTLAKGDTIRITANGTTKDRKSRLHNGSTYQVVGFTGAGDIVLNNGWVVDQGFGHFTQGYVVTSFASQGKTVDRVLIAQSKQSFPASSPEQFYVSASRARSQLTLYTDDKAELKYVIQQSKPQRSAIDLVKTKQPSALRRTQDRMISFLRRLRMLDRTSARPLLPARGTEPLRVLDHERYA